MGGCASSTDAAPPTVQTDAGPVCRLNSCVVDEDCATCPGGQTSCNSSTHECFPPPTANPGPTGPACPTDANGNPMIVCSSDSDCGPCDLMHQVCDPARSRCVSCTTAEQSRACGPTATCNASDQCVNACPTSCTSDADCSQCNGAHACNLGICEQCSPTHPCAAPQQCGRGGTCNIQCGTNGQGTCLVDGDCAGCGASTSCNVPINGGNGSCAVPASGCSEIGKGVAVLPDPYDQVTNLCSTDNDCSGVGINYNVGKLLRDLTGISSIHDADVFYGMNSCAALSLSLDGNSLSCGVCVPCEIDTDCQNINVDQVLSQALGPLGGFASSLVLDEVFGSNDHEVHMYCQSVAAGYGACVPCPGVVSACGGN
jgi:hypothetical protein